MKQRSSLGSWHPPVACFISWVLVLTLCLSSSAMAQVGGTIRPPSLSAPWKVDVFEDAGFSMAYEIKRPGAEAPGEPGLAQVAMVRAWWYRDRSFSSADEIRAFLEDARPGWLVSEFSIAGFQGFLHESAPEYKRGTGGMLSGYGNSDYSINGGAILTNGGDVVAITYQAGAQGHWDNRNEKEVIERGIAMISEVRNIVNSIVIRLNTPPGAKSASPSTVATPPAPKPIDASAKVCPPYPNRSPRGLLPAIDGSVAVVSYSGTPNTNVQVTTAEVGIPDNMFVKLGAYTAGKLDVAHSSDNPILNLQTDAAGLGRVAVFLKMEYHTSPRVLTGSGSVTVTFVEKNKAGRSAAAVIDVGLGLKVTSDRMFSVSQDPDDSIQHAWRILIDSRFHPGLNMVDYMAGLKACDPKEELSVPVVNINSVAINYRQDPATLIDGIAGAAGEAPGSLMEKSGVYYTFGRNPAGETFLTPLRGSATPQLKRPTGDVYPAVTHKDENKYQKGYYGQLRVLPRKSLEDRPGTRGQGSLEPRVIDRRIFVLSLENPEPLYNALLCMFEPQDVGQLALLAWLNIAADVIPLGQPFALTAEFCSLACDLSRRDYVKAGQRLSALGLRKWAQIGIKKEMVPDIVGGKFPPRMYDFVGINPATLDPNEVNKVANFIFSALWEADSALIEAAQVPAGQPALSEKAPVAAGGASSPLVNAAVPAAGLSLRDLVNSAASGAPASGFSVTVNALQPAADRFGRAGAAWAFDGRTSSLAVAHNPALTLTRAATVSAWFKLDQLPSQAGRTMTIMAKSGPGTDLDLHVEPDNRIKFYVGPGVAVASRTTMSAGTWYHATGSFTSNGLMELFVNGMLEASQQANFVRTSNNNPLTVGMSAQWGGRQLLGAVADPLVFDRALSSADVTALYQQREADAMVSLAPAAGAGAAGSPPATDALVGAWLLHGDARNGGAVLFSGQEKGGSPVGDRRGRPSVARRFSGPEAGIEVTHHPRLELVRGSTYAAWFKLDRLPSEAGRIMTIVSKPGPGADLDLHIEPDNRIKFYVGGGTVLVSRTPVTSGQWIHVAATYQANGQMELYINGQLDVRRPMPDARAANDNPLGIGVNTFWRGRSFEGAISEVLVYDRALNAAEISAIYEISELTVPAPPIR